MTKRVLTGINTTGTLHIGNYVGAIRPAIRDSRNPDVQSFFFLADLHALIKCQDPARIERSRRQIAATWLAAGLDPDKVVLFGQSAGGNLVANVCMAEADAPAVRPLAAVIAYAPMDFKTDPADKFHPERDMPAERARGYNALYCTPEKTGDWRVSPLFAPPERLAAFPQTLIITAGDDSLAPEGEEFARSLARAGVETTCKRFVGCLHGFFINRTDTWEDGIELIHRYLRNVLQDSAQ